MAECDRQFVANIVANIFWRLCGAVQKNKYQPTNFNPLNAWCPLIGYASWSSLLLFLGKLTSKKIIEWRRAQYFLVKMKWKNPDRGLSREGWE